MRRTLALALVPSIALGLTMAGPASAEGSGKVTQSSAAAVGEYPGQVSLVPAGSPPQPYCGGTQILPDWVLTAAHCVDEGPGNPPASLDVIVGTTRLDGSGQQVATDQTIVHPDYDFPSNDIALLHLVTPTTTPLARLAFPGHQVLEEPNTTAFVTGWGGLSGDEDNQSFPVDLQEGEVPVISDEVCQQVLGGGGDDSVRPDNIDLIVCAGLGGQFADNQADACRGDSGGPLWAVSPDNRLRQIGIVSGGPTCGFSPTYYTSVQTFTDFIEATTGQQLASFPDIVGITLEREVENLVVHGITAGDAQGNFVPSGQTSRAQLATFVNRVLAVPAPAPGTPHPFNDVNGGGVHDGNIEALHAADVILDTADGRYRPADNATRGEMAGFIARALQLDPVETGPFDDVPPGSPEAGAINALAERGVVLVGADRLFRPNDPISRAQISAILVRAFLAAG